jgi:hypothetical protein
VIIYGWKREGAQRIGTIPGIRCPRLLKEGDPRLVDYLERARSGFAGPTST